MSFRQEERHDVDGATVKNEGNGGTESGAPLEGPGKQRQERAVPPEHFPGMATPVIATAYLPSA
jgi:hypothetical protein